MSQNVNLCIYKILQVCYFFLDRYINFTRPFLFFISLWILWLFLAFVSVLKSIFRALYNYAYVFLSQRQIFSIRHPQHVQLSGFWNAWFNHFYCEMRKWKKYTVRVKSEFFMSRSYIRGLQIGKNCVHSCGGKKIKLAT